MRCRKRCRRGWCRRWGLRCASGGGGWVLSRFFYLHTKDHPRDFSKHHTSMHDSFFIFKSFKCPIFRVIFVCLDRFGDIASDGIE